MACWDVAGTDGRQSETRLHLNAWLPTFIGHLASEEVTCLLSSLVSPPRMRSCSQPRLLLILVFNACEIFFSIQMPFRSKGLLMLGFYWETWHILPRPRAGSESSGSLSISASGTVFCQRPPLSRGKPSCSQGCSSPLKPGCCQTDQRQPRPRPRVPVSKQTEQHQHFKWLYMPLVFVLCSRLIFFMCACVPVRVLRIHLPDLLSSHRWPIRACARRLALGADDCPAVMSGEVKVPTQVVCSAPWPAVKAR